MKKYHLNIIIKLILFGLVYIGVQWLIKFAILDDTMTISRVMLHDLYKEENNIDILFCGASHVQLGIDPVSMDESFGQNTFNAASSSQGLETTYALIREAASKNDLKEVYVDLDYSVLGRKDPDLTSIYIISDYMKPSVNKIRFLLEATDFDYYINSFMPLHKGYGYLKNPSRIIDNLAKKLKRGYLFYEDCDPSYQGKGYIASRTVLDAKELSLENYNYNEGKLASRDFYSIPKENFEILENIICFCKGKGIKLNFVCLPSTDFCISNLPDYDFYVDSVRNFLTDYDLEYYDFNLAKYEYFDSRKCEYFNDDNHLNINGSHEFDKLFSEIFTGRISKEEAFFESFDEKRKAGNK